MSQDQGGAASETFDTTHAYGEFNISLMAGGFANVGIALDMHLSPDQERDLGVDLAQCQSGIERLDCLRHYARLGGEGEAISSTGLSAEEAAIADRLLRDALQNTDDDGAADTEAPA